MIANDVDPIETVLFLPTLCRTFDIPFCVVQNRARLGELVNKKRAAVVALTDFKVYLLLLTLLSRKDNQN